MKEKLFMFQHSFCFYSEKIFGYSIKKMAFFGTLGLGNIFIRINLAKKAQTTDISKSLMYENGKNGPYLFGTKQMLFDFIEHNQFLFEEINVSINCT